MSTIIQGLVNTANTTFQGQYLFGGSNTQTAPFQILANGAVLYNGDQSSINSNVDVGLVAPNNTDGITAFAQSPRPSVPTSTRPHAPDDLSDLNDGQGVPPARPRSPSTTALL